MIDNFAEKLSIAYDGYVSKPDANELIERCAEAMDLSIEQQNRLIEAFAERQGRGVEDGTSEEAGEEEEPKEWID